MKINKIVMIVTVSMFVLLSGGFYCLSQSGAGEEATVVADVSADKKQGDGDCGKESKKEAKTIFIHVCGAVKKPGVYELPGNARICDAIKAASGLKKKAADVEVNQAQTLQDGEQVYIPFKETGENVQGEQQGTAGAGVADGKVSLNRATAEELMTLPGIGESKAASIIQYREDNGNFQSIEDIKKIQGIKDGVFQKISDYITL